MSNKPGRPLDDMSERLKLAQAERHELKLAKERAEVLPTAAVRRQWLDVLFKIKTVINQCETLSLKQKAEILKECAEIPLEKYQE